MQESPEKSKAISGGPFCRGIRRIRETVPMSISPDSVLCRIGKESGKLVGRSHADEDVPRLDCVLWRRVSNESTVGTPDRQHKCASAVTQMCRAERAAGKR